MCVSPSYVVEVCDTYCTSEKCSINNNYFESATSLEFSIDYSLR